MYNEHHSDHSYREPDPLAASDIAIGKRIRSCRQELHMSQKELGIRLGHSTSYISRIESGRRPLTHQMTLALLRCLGVTYDYLILGRTNSPVNLPGAVYEAAAYNDRLRFEHLLANCTKSEYEMCYQLCHAYLQTSRTKKILQNNPPSTDTSVF